MKVFDQFCFFYNTVVIINHGTGHYVSVFVIKDTPRFCNISDCCQIKYIPVRMSESILQEQTP